METRVCVIGAGSSGIAAAQVLHARGIPFDCFEVGSTVGGNWRYQNDNGMSSAYRSLHINTSRQQMEYRAFPMPDDLPDYPNHWQIAEYFDAYVDHFGFRDKIAFRTEVVKVEPPGETAGTTSRCGPATTHGEPSEPEVRPYSHVVVANGHHWDPRWPEPSYAGAETFTGEQMHAHYYRTPDVLEGKRVLVLGIGNSASDIAVESSRVADETYLAMRRGAHVVPKYMFGVPSDHLTDSPLARGPLALQRLGMAAMLRLDPGPGDRLRPAEARPPDPARAPDGLRRPADPARPRRHRGAPEHRPVRGQQGVLRRRHAPPRWTWSSTAPATR